MITATHSHTVATVTALRRVVDAAQLVTELGPGHPVLHQPVGREDLGPGLRIGHHGERHVWHITVYQNR